MKRSPLVARRSSSLGLRRNGRRAFWAATLLVTATALAAADLPKIVFTKAFPGSVPEYVEIALDKEGHGVYKEGKTDDNPMEFQLAPAETETVFALAAKLDRFSKPIEAPVKVAFMGDKTFRWENGSEKHEVKFNFSALPEAEQLWDWFERMSETEQRFAVLDNAAHFDKLGVNQGLLEMEAAFDRRRLVGLAQFLPLLDRIAGSERYMHMARERAAALADAIRNPPPKAPAQ
jgi:hypothetical protein